MSDNGKMDFKKVDNMLFGKLGDRQNLTPVEIADAIKISVRTVYRWYEEGRIAGSLLSKGTLRIIRSSMVEFYLKGIDAKIDFELLQKTAENKTDKKPMKHSAGGWVKGWK